MEDGKGIGRPVLPEYKDIPLELLCLPNRLNGERLAAWVHLAKPQQLFAFETFGLEGLGERCQSMSNRVAGAAVDVIVGGATSRSPVVARRQV